VCFAFLFCVHCFFVLGSVSSLLIKLSLSLSLAKRLLETARRNDLFCVQWDVGPKTSFCQSVNQQIINIIHVDYFGAPYIGLLVVKKGTE